MQKTIVFILNPISGSGSKNRFLRKVTQIDKWEGWTYKTIFTERVGHATEIALEYSGKTDYIIAVGGDGTVHEVAKGVAGSSSIFGIIPMGSGNGVARHLKISMYPKIAIADIRDSGIHKVDTLRVNEEFLLGVGGAGFDAHIAHQFDKAKTRGISTYAHLTLKEYFKFKALDFEFEIDNKKRSGKAFLFGIANSSQWGNDFYISPESSMKGGKAKLIIVEETDKASVSILAPALLTRSVLKLPFVKSYDFSELKFNLSNFLFHIDGEPKVLEGEQIVRVVEEDLLVCLPGHKV
ncbi:MAG: hypothetical protein KAH10_06080 [Flavobacteriales bacterium]|nr:hypothetical protein [Flavobacteriales bacterium]